MTELLKLAERIEAGEDAPAFVQDIVIGLGLPLSKWGMNADEEPVAILGSLDAAKALHDAVLPENGVRLDMGANIHLATILYYEHYEGDFRGCAPTPAASWVAAILRARAEMPVSETPKEPEMVDYSLPSAHWLRDMAAYKRTLDAGSCDAVKFDAAASKIERLQRVVDLVNRGSRMAMPPDLCEALNASE